MAQEQLTEFSRLIAVAEMEPGEETRRSLEADEQERAALATRLGLVALDSLSAEVAVRRLPGGPLYRVSGHLEGDVVQSCVVTLEPVPGHVSEDFDELFAEEGHEPPEDDEEADIPEYFDGEAIDLGELAAQILALSLNPYPRTPGAILKGAAAGEEDVSDRRRPFEDLAEMLKDRK